MTKQTAKEILRDELGLDENKYTKVQRDRFVWLIENYNNSDAKIDNFEYELEELADRNSDLELAIEDWISTLKRISERDDIKSIIRKIKKAIKELELDFYLEF